MITIQHLNVRFKDEVIYNDFSLTINKGEKLAITGASGKGKSTLLNVLAGFLTHYGGEIKIADMLMSAKTIHEIRKNIAWLPQEMALNIKTVEELFFAPFEFVVNKSNKPKREAILEIFNALEISETLLTKKLKEISGGQKQRIILASCLLLNKPILMLDEPTSALDENIKRKVTDYIMAKQNLTVVAVTHDEYWMNASDKTIRL